MVDEGTKRNHKKIFLSFPLKPMLALSHLENTMMFLEALGVVHQ